MMSEENQSLKSTARRESIIFLALLLVGLIVLPAVVYMVGRAVFGEYGGAGFSAFYSALLRDLLSAKTAAWFLVLSPYIVWQLLRLTFHAFKTAGRG